MVGRRQTGNERVIVNLAKALAERAEHQIFLYFTDRDVACEWQAARVPNLHVRTLGVHNPIARRGFAIGRSIRRDGVEVLLAQYNKPLGVGIPVVTLVHDVSFARHPEYFGRLERMYLNRTVPWSLKRSRLILTGSEFSRSEMADLYGLDVGKIVVTPYGIDPVFRNAPHRAPGIEPPYFLAVGNLQPRKNLRTLIQAFRRAVTECPELPERLVLVGQERGLSEEIYKEAEGLRQDGRVVFTGFVDDSELVSLLRGATAFLFPSLYEGFGFPPLEAMACGCPVAASAIPVMREVVGDAGLPISPRDAEAWADAMLRLASDATLRDDLTRKGAARAAGYTWERTALGVTRALERAAAR